MAKKSNAVRHPAPGVQKAKTPIEEKPTANDVANDEEAAMRLEEELQLFGQGLQTMFDKEVGLKEEIERRWLDDLRHYNGVYDLETQRQIQTEENKSRIFVNLTRSKCNTAESKWGDLVLPTDDRNWGIKPTPVPSLADSLTDETELVLENGQVPADPDTGEPYKKKDLAEAVMAEAKKKAKAMEMEIDDQLTEAKFNPTCRDVIHNAVVMGTGIIKGPMVESRVRKAWLEDEQTGEWVLSSEKEFKPTAHEVDPWNFFPDMAATRWEDAERVFERHMMTKKQLRNLAKQPGFMANQIAKILGSSPNGNSAKLNYLNELREINGITQIQHDNRYEVLEYHGPIDKHDLITAGAKNIDLDNPLEEYEGVVWVCMGIVFKVGLNHMDTNELPYNVLTWEKDDSSIFGFGVPYRMRNPQKVMNASWRMVLDNAGLSTGPQLLVNRKLVEPANGRWELSPRKVWWMTSSDPKFRADYAMQTFNIDSNQVYLTNIFEMAHRLADEETSVPQMQMGSQSGDTQQPAMLKTLGGTALWMSSNNIMMRRAVKNFDDDLLTPFITRFYDWNMQFNRKSEIKGDFTIDARGTSVLLVREMQSRNIQEFVGAAMAMPEGPSELKTRGVLKHMAKGMQLNAEDVMRSDDEYEAAVEEAKTNPPTDPEMMKLQAQDKMNQDKINWEREKQANEINVRLSEAQARVIEAQTMYQANMTKLAAEGQIKMDANQKKFMLDQANLKWNIKSFYEELAVKQKEGLTANYGLEADSDG